ncbi:high affinity copper uptake protein 1-like [Musca vetustissima]|uniref:high affinity copper uptake protein 1-like n=1 Tax=Musca vetustissima TaxID=27455 RepID=UPI002AB5FD35|nr:high affinity copper uptake protein 1-like [Musca vetustissima]
MKEASLRAKHSHGHKDDEMPTTSSHMPLLGEKTYLQKVFAKPHLIQTSINVIQVILSYLLMLVFMTYNYWLCMAVVLGLAVGYLFFGWIKQDVYDNEYCCEFQNLRVITIENDLQEVANMAGPAGLQR